MHLIAASILVVIMAILIFIKLSNEHEVFDNEEQVQKFKPQFEVMQPKFEYTTTEESEVSQIKEVYPELRFPTYIPEGYVYEYFTIKISDDDCASLEYKYAKDQDFLIIRQTDIKDGSITLNNFNDIENTDDGTLYYFHDLINESNSLILLTKDNITLDVIFLLDQEELTKVINGLEK